MPAPGNKNKDLSSSTGSTKSTDKTVFVDQGFLLLHRSFSLLSISRIADNFDVVLDEQDDISNQLTSIPQTQQQKLPSLSELNQQIRSSQQTVYIKQFSFRIWLSLYP